MTSLRMLRSGARALARVVVTSASAVGVVLLAATAASANGYRESSEPGTGLTVVQTLLLYVVTPAVIFGLIALVVVGPSLGKGARHRTGAVLQTGPEWIDPAGAHSAEPTAPTSARPGATDQGGASAHW